MQILPITPGFTEQRFATAIGDVTYLIDLFWNDRDECWYLDVLEEDETPIFHGAKIVLGAHLGRIHRHRLLLDGAFIAVDTSKTLVDAGFYDLGRRVLLVYVPADEIVAARANARFA